MTVKQILTGIQELLDSPNNSDAAQEPAWRLLQQSVPKYIERVKTEVAKYPAEGGGERGGAWRDVTHGLTRAQAAAAAAGIQTWCCSERAHREGGRNTF